MKRILILLVLSVFIGGCSKDDNDDSINTNEALIEKVWEHSKNNPDGFTLDLETMKPVKFGISVAYLETQNSFDKPGLEKAIKHALKNQKVVGGWLNSDDDLYYFDSVKIFENSELDEALEFAKRNKQVVIFDLTNLKEIRVQP